MTKQDDFVGTKGKKKVIFGKHVNRYYLRHAFALLMGLITLTLVDYVQLKVPEVYKLVVNGISDGYIVENGVQIPFDMPFLLSRICMPLIVVIVVMVIGRFLWRICFFGTALKVERHIRHRMFDKAKDLPQSYYQKNKVGHMMSLFTNDIETIHECFGSGVLMVGDAILLGGLAILKMGRMNWLLTLFSMIPMALLLCIGTLVGNFMMKKWAERQEAFSALSDFSQESFSGIAVIKAFVKEYRELSAFKKLNKNNENANVTFTKASSLLHIFVTLFVESVICVILGYGGYLVYTDVFDAGQLIEFIGYFSSVVWPVMAVSQLIDMSARGKASLGRISELLDAENDIESEHASRFSKPLTGKIEFKNLTFTHPGAEVPALRDVSFTIEAGERVGIIGKTGAGKTTVADLLLRTYPIPEGMLFLDGTDITHIPVKDVRNQISYVPQDNFLFSTTIAQNIAFALDDYTADEVEQAAKLADVHSNIVEFPEQYATVLGERGVTVSGGQKQRISIARALAKDAPILILDDAVSAVDTATERVILGNFYTTRKGKTTLMIAHRISTVAQSDKIVFLDDGKVVAVGTHESLYQTCDSYRRMVDLQKLEEEKGDDINA